MMNLDMKNLINNIMGVSESSQKTVMNHLSDVLGSFDCTCKSKCCEYFKCINLYYHCRTTNKDNINESEEEEIPQTPLSDNLLN